MKDQDIWNFLLDKIGNPYGVAGLMGNLYIESRLDPGLLQSTYARKFGMTSSEYTIAVDNGTYTNFVHDSAGYGLAQWTYWSRKEALLNFAKKQGASICDLIMQLDYLWSELQTYKTVVKVLKEAKSVREASDIVLEKYERPTDQSEEARQRRAKYGQLYFDQFSKQIVGKQVIVLTDRVNVRVGNDKKYKRILMTNKDKIYNWIATSENGWHAIDLVDQVGWISGEFSKVI